MTDQSNQPLTFEEHFEREILKSEQRRASIIVFLFGLAIVYFLCMFFIFPQFLIEVFGAADIFYYLVTLPILVCAYGLALRHRISRCIKEGRHVPLKLRFFNALIETSIPSVMLLIAIRFLGPVDAFASPTPFVYFIFIILSTLRLDFRISLFTGVVAALEYALIYMIYCWWPGHADLTGILTSPLPNLAKCLLYVLAGGTAGLVTTEVKNRVRASIKNIEERREVLNLFGQHVSPEVVNRLLDQKGEVDGEIKHVAVMFLDIRGFTRFAEGRSPREIVEYLNKLFSFMVDIINSNGGIVNKFLGDGFMAVFGAPLSDGQDSRNAVAAAVAIEKRVQANVKAKIIPPTRIGIGIHTGEVMTGTVGSKLRKEYTIIGDVVNLASRIEQLNKKFESSVLISGDTWRDLQDTEKEKYPTEHVGDVPIKGRDSPIEVYRLQ